MSIYFNDVLYPTVRMVVGQEAPSALETKEVEPAEVKIEVTPDEGYDALEKVIVDPVSSTYVGTDIPRRSSSDLAASSATVTIPAGYYSNQASKSVNTATQATPTIAIDGTTGLITATSTQSSGYVSGGTKSATQQLTTQAAKTVTPSTSEQTVVNSGVYTTGTVKVAAIQTETKTASSNGDVVPTSGKYLSKVTVAIPVYDGTVV